MFLEGASSCCHQPFRIVGVVSAGPDRTRGCGGFPKSVKEAGAYVSRSSKNQSERLHVLPVMVLQVR
jgi:hypothetical protein